jgi:hypothetical protein
MVEVKFKERRDDTLTWTKYSSQQKKTAEGDMNPALDEQIHTQSHAKGNGNAEVHCSCEAGQSRRCGVEAETTSSGVRRPVVHIASERRRKEMNGARAGASETLKEPASPLLRNPCQDLRVEFVGFGVRYLKDGQSER